MTARLVTQDDVPPWSTSYGGMVTPSHPYEPTRTDDYFTADTRHDLVADALSRHANGVVVPLVITAGGDLAGRITINDIVRGAFQSAHLGHWVAQGRLFPHDRLTATVPAGRSACGHRTERRMIADP